MRPSGEAQEISARGYQSRRTQGRFTTPAGNSGSQTSEGPVNCTRWVSGRNGRGKGWGNDGGKSFSNRGPLGTPPPSDMLSTPPPPKHAQCSPGANMRLIQSALERSYGPGSALWWMWSVLDRSHEAVTLPKCCCCWHIAQTGKQQQQRHWPHAWKCCAPRWGSTGALCCIPHNSGGELHHRERFCVKHADAGLGGTLGGTGRGRRNACEQRDNCPTLTE